MAIPHVQIISMTSFVIYDCDSSGQHSVLGATQAHAQTLSPIARLASRHFSGTQAPDTKISKLHNAKVWSHVVQVGGYMHASPAHHSPVNAMVSDEDESHCGEGRV